jgi:hypothetical protein
MINRKITDDVILDELSGANDQRVADQVEQEKQHTVADAIMTEEERCGEAREMKEVYVYVCVCMCMSQFADNQLTA